MKKVDWHDAFASELVIADFHNKLVLYLKKKSFWYAECSNFSGFLYLVDDGGWPVGLIVKVEGRLTMARLNATISSLSAPLHPHMFTIQRRVGILFPTILYYYKFLLDRFTYKLYAGAESWDWWNSTRRKKKAYLTPENNRPRLGKEK